MTSIQAFRIRLYGCRSKLRSNLQILDAVAEVLLREAVLEQTPERCRLDVRKLTRHPEPLIRHALTVLWIQQNWPRREMGRDRWKRLSALLFNTSPSSLDLPGQIRAELRGNLLSLAYRH